jgi:hypothetical protein
MGINVPDANSMKRISVDELQNFIISRHARLGQVYQAPDHKIAAPKITEGDLTGYKRVP